MGYVRSMRPALALAITALSCLIAPTQGIAQTAADGTSATLESEVARYLDPLVQTNNFYGAVFIARGNRVLVNKGYGLASIEHGVPNTAESVFQIASVSKPFTATAVLLLAQRGLVDLKAPLSKILPDYPNGARLTLHHLLLHTSGIPDINVQPVYAELSLQHQSPGSLVAAFKDLPLAFEPGARFSYSNSNYNLLALIIERVTGKSYGQFLRDEFFCPAWHEPYCPPGVGRGNHLASGGWLRTHMSRGSGARAMDRLERQDRQRLALLHRRRHLEVDTCVLWRAGAGARDAQACTHAPTYQHRHRLRTRRSWLCVVDRPAYGSAEMTLRTSPMRPSPVSSLIVLSAPTSSARQRRSRT